MLIGSDDKSFSCALPLCMGDQKSLRDKELEKEGERVADCQLYGCAVPSLVLSFRVTELLLPIGSSQVLHSSQRRDRRSPHLG